MIAVPPECTPLLVFVNSKSGGKQGAWLIPLFQKLLNPMQICDLAIEGPNMALRQFAALPRSRARAPAPSEY